MLHLKSSQRFDRMMAARWQKLTGLLPGAWEHVDRAGRQKRTNYLRGELLQNAAASSLRAQPRRPEFCTLNNSHPQAWGLETTGFEWSIASSAKYASTSVMHFRTGGISGFLNPSIAHPAVGRPPSVINR